MLYLTINDRHNIPSCLSLKWDGFFVIFCFKNVDTLVPLFFQLQFEQILVIFSNQFSHRHSNCETSIL